MTHDPSLLRVALSTTPRCQWVLDALVEPLAGRGIDVKQCSSDDFLLLAHAVAQSVAQGEVDRGIIASPTGTEVCIAANKVRSVRAVIATDPVMAARSREREDTNVLCLPAELLGARSAIEVMTAWLDTPFAGGVYAERLKTLEALESGQSPYKFPDTDPSSQDHSQQHNERRQA